MSFDGIRVNHGILEQAAADLKTYAGKIDNRLNDLEGQLKPLQSDWTGSAKESYHVAKTQWDKAIAEMIQLLEQVSVAVGESNTEYKNADARGAGRFA
ncbi:WXG100 family type VII secretion target [Nocardioides sp. 616]|uniref:WXG100 family type VII secretion target n=1 Tax=Nocardioides sp. 616 TaxID=2268090 RepID=UPI000CE38C2F|nr:WXG100 family type VII secretion target [Nocardioides sp. 616]